MKYLPLIWANLMRHRRRTVLTTLSVALALFLFASLRSVTTTLEAATGAGSEIRMIVRNATGIVIPLPMSYRQRLEAVDGVREVAAASWFGGWYRNEREFFANFAIDGPFLEIYPEIVVPPGEWEAYQQDRTGALVGVDLMEKYGWRVGQDVTLNGTIFPGAWTFTIRGTYTVTNKSFDEMSFIFHHAYLEERADHRYHGWYYLLLEDPDRAADVAAAIDAQYRNSSAATRTETERAFNAGFVSMFGNVQFLMTAIGIAVVFAILLVTGNAMMMSARERTSEVAVLKALGYGHRLLFGIELAEAGFVALLGALLGIGGARWLWSVVEPAPQFMPGFSVTDGTLAEGAALAVALTLASGLLPAIRAWRLPVVDALRTVE